MTDTAHTDDVAWMDKPVYPDYGSAGLFAAIYAQIHHAEYCHHGHGDTDIFSDFPDFLITWNACAGELIYANNYTLTGPINLSILQPTEPIDTFRYTHISDKEGDIGFGEWVIDELGFKLCPAGLEKKNKVDKLGYISRQQLNKLNGLTQKQAQELVSLGKEVLNRLAFCRKSPDHHNLAIIMRYASEIRLNTKVPAYGLRKSLYYLSVAKFVIDTESKVRSFLERSEVNPDPVIKWARRIIKSRVGVSKLIGTAVLDAEQPSSRTLSTGL